MQSFKDEANDLVSVYIISCNRPLYLKRAIMSVVNQTYKNIEILIVDDASDEFDFKSYIEDLDLPTHIMIKTFQNESSKRANFCRNLALNNASGKYITGLDDDDYFHPKRVEIMLNAYKAGNYSAISALSCYETPTGPCSKQKLKTFLKNLLIPNRTITFEDIKVCNYLSNQILTEVSKLKSIGGFDESLPSMQDYETWFRLIKTHGPAQKLGRVLYHCALSQKSTTKRSGKKLEGHKFFYRKHGSEFDLKDRRSFRINLEYKRQGRVTISTLLKNVNKKNFTRVMYLMVFKSCINSPYFLSRKRY